MWRIHGVEYNLIPFLDEHPGGKDVLLTAMNQADASAMFESYHALSGQQDRIWKLLQKYRVEKATDCDEKSFQVDKSKVSVNDSMLAATHVSRDTCENVCNFEETAKERRAALFPDDGFYRTLAHRLKAYFAEQARKSGIDARSALKATNWWTIKVSLYIALWLCVLITGICVRWASWKLSAPMLVMLGFLQGTFHIACGFCVMHDASHYAISTKPWLNELFSRMTNATLSWFHHIWARHHVYAHHSFTGDIRKDPDTKYGRPIFRKHPEDPYQFSPTMLQLQPWSSILLVLFPGQFLGQMLLYLKAFVKGRYLGVPVTHMSAIEDVWVVEVLVMLMSHLVWWVGLPWIQTISYFCAMNMWYWMCIAPDHDTWESAFKNKKAGEMDWGEMQVRESGSFAVNMPWVCSLFGGINYQIEHHLFPGISHVHYPQISPIIQQTCEEFGIPYNKHGTWMSAIHSVIRNYRECGKCGKAKSK